MYTTLWAANVRSANHCTTKILLKISGNLMLVFVSVTDKHNIILYVLDSVDAEFLWSMLRTVPTN